MIKYQNKFGSGQLCNEDDLEGPIYAISTACMSIWSEFLSWANANVCKIVKFSGDANNIVVLSCQVTDLAILNDLNQLKGLMDSYPDKQFYIGGCLARRFDIPLPEGVRRLDNMKCDGQWIHDRNLIDYAPPFWVNNFKEDAGEFSQGHLFRNMYPLRIGVGCKNKCKFCTIRVTRGDNYEIPFNLDEFKSFQDVLLVADSPSSEQIVKWCEIADIYNKPISIRNLEPHEAVKSRMLLEYISSKGLLKVLHVPIQSPDIKILKDMNRPVLSTLKYMLEMTKQLKNNTFLATNIIIDYKECPNPNMDELNNLFDYISWNPYWDGIWDIKKAEERYNKYIF